MVYELPEMKQTLSLQYVIIKNNIWNANLNSV